MPRWRCRSCRSPPRDSGEPRVSELRRLAHRPSAVTRRHDLSTPLAPGCRGHPWASIARPGNAGLFLVEIRRMGPRRSVRQKRLAITAGARPGVPLPDGSRAARCIDRDVGGSPKSGRCSSSVCTVPTLPSGSTIAARSRIVAPDDDRASGVVHRDVRILALTEARRGVWLRLRSWVHCTPADPPPDDRCCARRIEVHGGVVRVGPGVREGSTCCRSFRRRRSAVPGSALGLLVVVPYDR